MFSNAISSDDEFSFPFTEEPFIPLSPTFVLLSSSTPNVTEPQSTHGVKRKDRLQSHRAADAKRRAQLSSLFEQLWQCCTSSTSATAAAEHKPTQTTILIGAIDSLKDLQRRLQECETSYVSLQQSTEKLRGMIGMLHQEASGPLFSSTQVKPTSQSTNTSSLSMTSYQQCIPSSINSIPMPLDVRYQKRYRRLNGDLVHARVRTTIIPDLAGCIHMIVSRIQPLSPSSSTVINDCIEGLLIASCEDFKLPVQHIHAVTSVTDLKLRYVDAFLCQLLGLDSQQCAGLTLGQISHPEDTLAVFRALRNRRLDL